MRMPDITADYVRSIFHYDPEAGLLMRKINRGGRGQAGVIVGAKRNYKGHLCTGIDGKYYALHRLIWLWVYGTWPENQIDHINCIPDDNRLCNLREATASENKCNQYVRIDSESGIKGVTQDKRTGRWRAYISKNGTRYWLGFFSTKNEAAAARIKASSLHGEFARG